MTSFIAAGGSGRSASVIPAVPAASSVTTIAFIPHLPVSSSRLLHRRQSSSHADMTRRNAITPACSVLGTASREQQQFRTAAASRPRTALRRPAMSCRRGPGPYVHDPAEKSLMMTIVITAFERSPDGGMGLARDTRVRWALEEVGQPYEVRLVSLEARNEPEHLRIHPFGLIPT